MCGKLCGETLVNFECNIHIAYIQLEGYASTRAKDGSWDVVEPDGIDLSRFEAGNAPLKAMHGRSVLSNIGVIKEAKVDIEKFWLYIKAEARLDLTEDKNGQKLVQEDYNLYTRLQEGVINGFSIGFHWIKERYDEDRDVNVIYSLQLHEISIVDVPDNPLTIMKMLDMYHEQKESEILDDDLTSMPKLNEESAEKAVKAVETAEATVEENAIEEVAEEEAKTAQEEEVTAENDEAPMEESGVSEEKCEETKQPCTHCWKSLSQESEDSWNTVADEPTPEVEQEDSDEGTKSLETKDEDDKALQDALLNGEKAIELVQKQTEMIAKLNEELAKYKAIKVSHGLVLTGTEKVQKPNVFNAVAEQIEKSL